MWFQYFLDGKCTAETIRTIILGTALQPLKSDFGLPGVFVLGWLLYVHRGRVNCYCLLPVIARPRNHPTRMWGWWDGRGKRKRSKYYRLVLDTGNVECSRSTVAVYNHCPGPILYYSLGRLASYTGRVWLRRCKCRGKPNIYLQSITSYSQNHNKRLNSKPKKTMYCK